MLKTQLAMDESQGALILEIVAMVGRKPAVGKYLSENIRIGYEMAAHGIAAQQRQGLIRGDADPHTLALSLVALFFGFQCLSLAGLEPGEIRERWLEIGEILLQPAATPANCSEGCPWTDEMGRRMADRGIGESIEIPVCPETCGIPGCTIRRSAGV